MAAETGFVTCEFRKQDDTGRICFPEGSPNRLTPVLCRLECPDAIQVLVGFDHGHLIEPCEEVSFEAEVDSVSKYFEVRWHGRGGQGTVTGAKTLAEAVQGTGRFVSAFPDYGPERRGAPVRAFNRFSRERIRIHIPVLEPNVVMIVDPTLIGSKDLVEGITDGTTFIVNTERDRATIQSGLGLRDQALLTVPANRISEELFGREIPNSAMMGAFARAFPGMITLAGLLEEAAETFSHLLSRELVTINLDAIKRGHDEALAT